MWFFSCCDQFWSRSTIYHFCPKTAHSPWACLPHVLIQFSFSSAAHCSVPYCPTNIWLTIPSCHLAHSFLLFYHLIIHFCIILTLSLSLSLHHNLLVLKFSNQLYFLLQSLYGRDAKSFFASVSKVSSPLSHQWPGSDQDYLTCGQSFFH